MKASSLLRFATCLCCAQSLVYFSSTPLFGQGNTPAATTTNIPTQVDINVTDPTKVGTDASPIPVSVGQMIRVFVPATAVAPATTPICDAGTSSVVSLYSPLLYEENNTVLAVYLQPNTSGKATVTFTYTPMGQANTTTVSVFIAVTGPPTAGTRRIQVTHDSAGNLKLTDAQTKQAVAPDAVHVGDILYFNAGQVGQANVEVIGALKMDKTQNDNGWYMYWAQARQTGLATINVTRPPTPSPAGGAGNAAALPAVPATFNATIRVQ